MGIAKDEDGDNGYFMCINEEASPIQYCTNLEGAECHDHVSEPSHDLGNGHTQKAECNVANDPWISVCKAIIFEM